MAKDLEGRVAIVTGAGASGPGWGTGMATAVCLARAGAKLVLLDIDAAACAITAGFVAGEASEAVEAVGDVTSPADAQAAVGSAIDRFGRLDILVNNVGIVSGFGLADETIEQWQRTMAVNALSAFVMAKHALPHLLASPAGRVINVASISALRITPVPPSYGYCASKAALIHMTRAMAVEFGRQGLRCNTVVPGTLDTNIVRSGARERNWSEDELNVMLEQRDAACVTGKQGTAFDIGEAVAFLASDRANFINGTEIVVDGGQIQTIAG